MTNTTAKINLWGSTIGYVSWDEDRHFATFEYENNFINNALGIEPSPLFLPRKQGLYDFRGLNKDTYKGLPGMLADCLPDKFGNAIIDSWLAKQGRPRTSFNPVEQLCYIGQRGMGALEFEPAIDKKTEIFNVNIEEMVQLASDILTSKNNFRSNLGGSEQGKEKSLLNLLSIGTSAGGARAKCLIAYNNDTKEIRSGQIQTASGFDYWLMKLDGVSQNKDKELCDPLGYGKIEFAYHLMAKDCEIEMTECRLFKENSRSHFMTKRFDRLQGGKKVHMHSLCGLAHRDFNLPRSTGYEKAFQVIREIVTTKTQLTLEQQYRRAIFNVIGRNHDDHTKNIAFLMEKSGQWKLSPAYDLTYSFNPHGYWTNAHQMTINGKSENFSKEDLLQLGLNADLKQSKASSIIKQVTNVFKKWNQYADIAGVSKATQAGIKKQLRINL